MIIKMTKEEKAYKQYKRNMKQVETENLTSSELLQMCREQDRLYLIFQGTGHLHNI